MTATKQNHSLATILTLFTAGTLFLNSGCDRQQTLSGVSGTVSVEGTDADSVIVRIYEKEDISADVSVWFVPGRESGVGFTYEAQRAFDFRSARAFKADTTNSEGKFNITDVPDGEYIIVADGVNPNLGGTHHKENFGWSKPLEISAGGSGIDVGTLQLRPDSIIGAENVPTVLSEDLTLRSDRHYVFKGRLIIRSGVTLTIEPGAVVRFYSGEGISVESLGELRCEGAADDYIVFTTDEIDARVPAEWSGISFDPVAEPPLFRYCRFEYALTAIETHADGGVVESSFFNRNTGEAILVFGDPPLFSRNVINRSSVGYQGPSVHNVNIEHCLFQTCDPFSIKLDSVTTGAIFCNWFRDGGGSDTSGQGRRGVIKLDWIWDYEIHQNTFETSWFAFTLGSYITESVSIHHNVFNRVNTVMYIIATEERRGPSNPRFNYNCMTSVDRGYITMVACQHNILDMLAENNYWNGNISPASIHENFLIDCRDDPLCGCILIEPVLSSCGQIEALTGSPPGVCQN